MIRGGADQLRETCLVLRVITGAVSLPGRFRDSDALTYLAFGVFLLTNSNVSGRTHF
jgi:hypothetical protein